MASKAGAAAKKASETSARKRATAVKSTTAKKAALPGPEPVEPITYVDEAPAAVPANIDLPNEGQATEIEEGRVDPVVAVDDGVKVSARVADNGRGTLVTVSGCGVGGHAGYLRFTEPVDYRHDFRWDGDEFSYEHETVVFAAGLFHPAFGDELRFEVEPLS